MPATRELWPFASAAATAHNPDLQVTVDTGVNLINQWFFCFVHRTVTCPYLVFIVYRAFPAIVSSCLFRSSKVCLMDSISAFDISFFTAANTSFSSSSM